MFCRIRRVEKIDRTFFGLPAPTNSHTDIIHRVGYLTPLAKHILRLVALFIAQDLKLLAHGHNGLFVPAICKHQFT